MSTYNNLERMYELDQAMLGVESMESHIQVKLLTMANLTLKSIAEEEGWVISTEELFDMDILAQEGVLASTGRGIAAGGRGVVATGRFVGRVGKGSWNVIKALLRAMTAVFSVMRRLSLKLLDRMVIFLQPRGFKLKKLLNWYVSKYDPGVNEENEDNSVTVRGAKLNKGRTVGNVTALSDHAGHRAVLLYLSIAVRDKVNIPDIKEVEYYLKNSREEGRWKVKVLGWNMDTTSSSGHDQALDTNVKIISYLNEDYMRINKALKKMVAMEAADNKRNRKEWKKYRSDPDDEAISVARESKNKTVVELPSRINQELREMVGKLRSGELQVSEDRKKIEHTPYKLKATKYVIGVTHDILDNILESLGNEQNVFTKSIAHTRDEINRRYGAKFRNASQAHASLFTRINIEEAKEMMTEYNKAFRILQAIIKSIVKTYLRVLDSIINLGMDLYIIDRDILADRQGVWQRTVR